MTVSHVRRDSTRVPATASKSFRVLVACTGAFMVILASTFVISTFAGPQCPQPRIPPSYPPPFMPALSCNASDRLRRLTLCTLPPGRMPRALPHCRASR